MRILITFLVAIFMIANPLPASDMPEWVVNPYSVYDQSLYIAATGTGSSRAAAEEDAISSIDLRPQKVTHLQLLSRRLQEGAGNEASHKGRTA